MKKINIKLIVSLAIVIILGNFISIFSFASFNMDSANLYSKGDCGRLIKKDGVGVKTSFVVYLKDGKTNINCVRIKGGTTDEFLEIFNKICDKVPTDCLKGYTKENQDAFKKYKKEIKRNGI